MLSVDGGRTFTSKPVYYTDENGNRRVNQGVDDLTKAGLKAPLRNAWTPAISRSRSGVRIAYCTSISAGGGSRQAYELLSVVWDDPAVDPKITSIVELGAEDRSGSVLYATFVETDRIELPKSNPSDAALLYWVETTGTKIRARGLVTHDDTGWSQPFDLSTRTWEPADDFSIGDYMKGAFYYDGSLNFLALWPEVTATSQECCYRVISVVPEAS